MSAGLLFLFDEPPRTLHGLFFALSSGEIPGCLIPNMLTPYQHLSWLPEAWATLRSRISVICLVAIALSLCFKQEE